ncbi:pimeloyl-ACP methyl ester carboxylesterase [Paraburkholderia sp. GAS334]
MLHSLFFMDRCSMTCARCCRPGAPQVPHRLVIEDAGHTPMVESLVEVASELLRFWSTSNVY